MYTKIGKLVNAFFSLAAPVRRSWCGPADERENKAKRRRQGNGAGAVVGESDKAVYGNHWRLTVPVCVFEVVAALWPCASTCGLTVPTTMTCRVGSVVDGWFLAGSGFGRRGGLSVMENLQATAYLPFQTTN